MRISESGVVLPINENPSIITCIHHAYPLGIIESKELAMIMIKDYDLDEWHYEPDNMLLSVQNGQVILSEEDNKRDVSNAVLWRECRAEDVIVIEVKYFKPRDINRHIDVFLFSENLRDEIAAEDKTCGVRWNEYGYFVGKNMYSFDTKKYTFCLSLCPKPTSH